LSCSEPTSAPGVYTPVRDRFVAWSASVRSARHPSFVQRGTWWNKSQNYSKRGGGGPDWLAIPPCAVLALLHASKVAVTTRAHRMPFGAEVQADGTVRFRLWAPSHREVKIELDGEAVVMRLVGEGWHELVTDRARADTHYRFVLPDGLRVPDPASRYQPQDV